jgi:hypothetical protein
LGWSALLAFSPCFFNIELSTFLKPCVSHFLKNLCYSSSRALPSSGDGVSGKWGEGGRRGNFGAEKGAERSLGSERGCVLVHPQNGLNSLILNWCTGGCWFTPAPKERVKTRWLSG